MFKPYRKNMVTTKVIFGRVEMESVPSDATAETGLSNICGYHCMSPSYDLDQEAASYPDIANALLENSSAHGLPTLYRAQGDTSHSAAIILHRVPSLLEPIAFIGIALLIGLYVISTQKISLVTSKKMCAKPT